MNFFFHVTTRNSNFELKYRYIEIFFHKARLMNGDDQLHNQSYLAVETKQKTKLKFHYKCFMLKSASKNLKLSNDKINLMKKSLLLSSQIYLTLTSMDAPWIKERVSFLVMSTLTLLCKV